MRKLLILLILSFFSTQGFTASCPDGSEPTKTVSEDGSYYVYNCVNTNSNVAMKPNTGDWISSDGLPMQWVILTVMGLMIYSC